MKLNRYFNKETAIEAAFCVTSALVALNQIARLGDYTGAAFFSFIAFSSSLRWKEYAQKAAGEKPTPRFTPKTGTVMLGLAALNGYFALYGDHSANTALVGGFGRSMQGLIAFFATTFAMVGLKDPLVNAIESIRPYNPPKNPGSTLNLH